MATTKTFSNIEEKFVNPRSLDGYEFMATAAAVEDVGEWREYEKGVQYADRRVLGVRYPLMVVGGPDPEDNGAVVLVQVPDAAPSDLLKRFPFGTRVRVRPDEGGIRLLCSVGGFADRNWGYISGVAVTGTIEPVEAPKAAPAK